MMGTFDFHLVRKFQLFFHSQVQPWILANIPYFRDHTSRTRMWTDLQSHLNLMEDLSTIEQQTKYHSLCLALARFRFHWIALQVSWGQNDEGDSWITETRETLSRDSSSRGKSPNCELVQFEYRSEHEILRQFGIQHSKASCDDVLNNDCRATTNRFVNFKPTLQSIWFSQGKRDVFKEKVTFVLLSINSSLFGETESEALNTFSQKTFQRRKDNIENWSELIALKH